MALRKFLFWCGVGTLVILCSGSAAMLVVHHDRALRQAAERALERQRDAKQQRAFEAQIRVVKSEMTDVDLTLGDRSAFLLSQDRALRSLDDLEKAATTAQQRKGIDDLRASLSVLASCQEESDAVSISEYRACMQQSLGDYKSGIALVDTHSAPPQK